MALSETLNRFINDPNDPKLLDLPQQASESRLPLVETIPSRRNQSPSAGPVLPNSTSSAQSTSPSNSPSPSILSRREPASSNTSTSSSDQAESLGGDVEAMSIIDDHELPCLLNEIMNCPVTFPLAERENWYLHSLSHYKGDRPPKHALCIFCHAVFDSDDPEKCWSARMYHIADHFENNWNMNRSRPDFRVLEDMWKKGCIPEDVYRHCFAYTERPRNSNLRPHDHIPEEIVKKRRAAYEQTNRIVIRESRQEMREIRDRQRNTHHRVSRPRS